MRSFQSRVLENKENEYILHCYRNILVCISFTIKSNPEITVNWYTYKNNTIYLKTILFEFILL